MKIKTRVCCILCTFLVGMPFTACMHDNKGSSGTDGISLSSVQQKVKDALGDDYVPDQSLDDAALEQLYGIKAEDLEEYSAEISSMSAHVDQFAAFKAKPDRADAVEQALRDYRERLVEDTMQYPSNIAKINASEVLRHGQYVFFLMLGAINDDVEMEEEEQIAFAKKENKKAVDAVNSCF